MSDINTNNVSFNDSGTAVISGVSSGIDSQGLIKSIIKAKSFEVDRIDTKIAANGSQISDMQEFQGLLSNFQSTLNSLRGGVGSTQLSAFDQKQVFSTSTVKAGAPVGHTASAAASIVSVNVDPKKAAVGEHTVEIVQLAKASQFRSDSFSSKTDTLVSQGKTAGSLQVGDVTIDIDADDTLLDLRDKINFSNGNVTASIVSASDTEHYLVVSGNETGVANAITVGGDLATHNSLGFTDTGTTDIKTSIQTAQDSIIRVDGLGVDIQRSTNKIDDVIEGITLDLLDAEEHTEIQIKVETNLNSVKQEIFNFTEQYNAIKDFIADQREEKVRSEDSDAEKEYGSLAFDPTVRRIQQEIDGLINKKVPGLEDGFSSLAEVGLGINKSYRLEMDEGNFDNKLLSNVKELEKLFSFSYESSDSRLRPISIPSNAENNTNGTSEVQPYYVNIAPQDADGKVVSANYTETLGAGAGGANNSSFEVDGNLVKGLNGELKGMSFVYAGEANGAGVDGIEFRFTRGIADQLFTTLDNMLSSDGAVSKAIDGLNESTETLEKSKTDIEARLEIERERLVRTFSAMERSVAISNSIIEQLKQQSAASNN